MNIKIVAALLFLFLSFSSYLKADGFYSYSIGQFDVNDTFDSLEARVEYLSNNNFNEKYELKPFLGFMVNTDSGKYFYLGLRKDYSLSNKWNLTPSFATGYYDQGSSKDLGNNLEFRSQLELSYNLEKNKRVGISLNHISNASLADQNPGTESIVISFINPFSYLAPRSSSFTLPINPTCVPNCDKPTIELATEPPEIVFSIFKFDKSFMNSSLSKINFILPLDKLF